MGADQLQPMERPRSFKLQGGALWMRVDIPQLDQAQRWYLSLDASAFTDSATLYQADSSAGWQTEQSGDHIPVNQWSIRDRAPTFSLDAGSDSRHRLAAHGKQPRHRSAPGCYLRTENELQLSATGLTWRLGPTWVLACWSCFSAGSMHACTPIALSSPMWSTWPACWAFRCPSPASGACSSGGSGPGGTTPHPLLFMLLAHGLGHLVRAGGLRHFAPPPWTRTVPSSVGRCSAWRSPCSMC